jgi:HSP20 family protein
MLARTIFPRPITNDFARMSREMDRLFESLAPTRSAERSKGLGVPPVNLSQDDANLYAELELPGVAPENVEILAQGDTLTIKGSRQIAQDERTKQVIRSERVSGSFERTMTLPVEIDADKVNATLKDGVLTITLPKAQAVLPRKIAVNAG